MDITVKFAGVVNSNESMNDFDRVAGVFSILTSQDVLSKRRLTQRQIETVNDSLESFAVDGYAPVLCIRDGYVTTESLSDAWGWVVEKISGVNAAIRAKLSAIKLWWDRLGFSYRQHKSRVKRISAKLDGGQDVNTDPITLKNHRFPEMFFNEHGEVRDRIKNLELYVNTQYEYVNRFVVPYFRKSIKSYSLARNVDLKSSRDFEYALEFLVNSYPEVAEYSNVLKPLSGDYAGYFALEYSEVSRQTRNWTERLATIGTIPLKVTAPDEVTRNSYRISAKRATLEPTDLEEITHVRDFLEANLDGLYACEKDLFEIIRAVYNEMEETTRLIESRIRVYRNIVHESEDTTVIVERQDPNDASNATKLIGLMKDFYNETSSYYEIGDSLSYMCTYYVDSYLRLAEDALSI